MNDIRRDTRRLINMQRIQPVTRSAKILAGLCLFALLSGCPQQPIVTVTIKPETKAAEGEAAATETEAKGYGNLVGTVTFEGSPPQLAPLVVVNDAKVKPEDRAVCAAAPVPDESLVVNADNKGLANVVIFLEKRPGNIKPELAQPPSDPVLFDQKGCRFLPHVLLVRAGQPLLVVSDDPIPHNTHTYPTRNDGFNQLIAAGERKGTPCNYKKPESIPLEVKCDYHAWMKAYHFPLDHPYVAVTDANGKFRIEGLPAGKHSFNVWHERGQLLERKLQITIEVDQDTTKDLSYGANKLAGAAGAPRRFVAFERLIDGGEIDVALKEQKP